MDILPLEKGAWTFALKMPKFATAGGPNNRTSILKPWAAPISIHLKTPDPLGGTTNECLAPSASVTTTLTSFTKLSKPSSIHSSTGVYKKVMIPHNGASHWGGSWASHWSGSWSNHWSCNSAFLIGGTVGTHFTWNRTRPFTQKFTCSVRIGGISDGVEVRIFRWAFGRRGNLGMVCSGSTSRSRGSAS